MERIELSKKEIREFGKTLTAVREHSGLTQAKLANEIAMTVPHVSKLENSRAFPRIDSLFDLITACGGKIVIEF